MIDGVNEQASYVGGGSVKRFALLSGEKVVKAGGARYRGQYWLTWWGELLLTTGRLIYCPSILMVFWDPFAIDLSSITDVCEVPGLRANLDVPSRIRVVADGQTHHFGFGLYGWRRRHEWVAAIRDQQASLRN